MDRKKRYKVLIVEDDPCYAEPLKLCLNQSNDFVTMDVTDSEQAALKLVRAGLPDAMIVDLQLSAGEGDGIQLLQQIRDWEAEKTLPLVPYILVLTSVASDRTWQRLNNGLADITFLKNAKSYSPEQIVKHLRAMASVFDCNLVPKPRLEETELTKEALFRKRIMRELDKYYIVPSNDIKDVLAEAIYLVIVKPKHEKLVMQEIMVRAGQKYGKDWRNVNTRIDKLKQEIEARKEIKSLVSRNHKYKHIIPAVNRWMDDIKEGGPNAAREQMEALAEISEEISSEFANEDLRIALGGLRLPSAWNALYYCIEIFAEQCLREGIDIMVQNHAGQEHWEHPVGPKSEFIRLAANLMDNARKELSKVESDSKSILILFHSKQGVFELEVHDTAPVFSLEILWNLGRRGNSTNGTGDGYAEVFKILRKYNASFKIYETGSENDCYKRINVAFDGQARASIHSEFRYDALYQALDHLGLEVYQL